MGRSLGSIVNLPILLILAVFLSGCTHRIQSKQGEMASSSSNRVVAKFYPSPPPAPGPKEREQGSAPPLKVGKFVRGQARAIPSSRGGEVKSTVAEADPPGDFVFFKNSPVLPSSATFFITAEPAVAMRDDPGGTKGLFYTGNVYAAVSSDDGGSFSFMNPFTVFPAVPSSFCCDQQAIYAPSRNLFFWLLQYNTTGGCSGTPLVCTGNNIYRIAVSNGAPGLTSGIWCYYDFSPQSLGLANGLQFDYPHVALSNNFFYFSANVYLSRSVAGVDWRQSSIVRIPLDPLTTCAGFSYSYLNVGNYDLDLAQGASDTMYFATVLNTSAVRVYRWAESSGTIFYFDRTVSSWTRGGSPCADPRGSDWCARSGNGGSSGTGWVNQSQTQRAGSSVGFMWNAAACTNPQSCGYNRPFPYIRVLRFDPATLNVVDEPDIWNPSYAFQYPAVGVNGRGHLGGTMFWGGGASFPTLVAFIWDDFTCDPYTCGWENYGAVASSASNPNWGDYLDSRPQSPNINTWTATGYGFDGTTLTPQFLWFGRARDTPP